MADLEFGQPDAAHGLNESFPAETEYDALLCGEDALEDTSNAVSYLSAARQSAKDAASRVDAERATRGPFKQYFSENSDHAIPGRRLKRAGLGVAAAVVVIGIFVVTARIFLSGQSLNPQVLARASSADLNASSKPGTLSRIQEPDQAAKPTNGPATDSTEGKSAPKLASVDPMVRSQAPSTESGGLSDRGENPESATSPTGVGSATPQSGSALTKLDHITALANSGDAHAQLMIGLLYLARNEGAAGEAKAANWLQRAATQGEAIAQYRLGALYATGRGVPADEARATQMYKSAAELGNRKAMYNLALAYVQGKGTAKNMPEAVRWFAKAANLGLVDAQFDLAILYERGTGVPQSLLDAYHWYAIAAKGGDHESKERIDALATQLPANDRAAAQESADLFKATKMSDEANLQPDFR